MMTTRLPAVGILACLTLGFCAACGSSSSPASGPTPGDGGLPSAPDATTGDDANTVDDAEAAVEAGAPVDAGEGGALVDANPGDGGRDLSTDRTAFFGDSRCADAGVQLCEDFESGMINSAIWKVNGTMPVVDTMQHARGTHALHITQDGNGLSYITEKTTFPEANNTYFGRVFVYFKSLPFTTADGGMPYAHWTMVAGSGTGVSGEIRLSGQLGSKGNLWGVGTDNQTATGTGDWTNSDSDPGGHPMAVPLNQWLCMEWMHKGDTNETQFWWDATLHPSLSTTASMHGGNSNPFLLPQFTQVWIGWQEYQTSTERFELWVDEIAIDSRRIGCVL
jgi:hypothetical protein